MPLTWSEILNQILWISSLNTFHFEPFFDFLVNRILDFFELDGTVRDQFGFFRRQGFDFQLTWLCRNHRNMSLGTTFLNFFKTMKRKLFREKILHTSRLKIKLKYLQTNIIFNLLSINIDLNFNHINKIGYLIKLRKS